MYLLNNIADLDDEPVAPSIRRTLGLLSNVACLQPLRRKQLRQVDDQPIFVQALDLVIDIVVVNIGKEQIESMLGALELVPEPIFEHGHIWREWVGDKIVGDVFIIVAVVELGNPIVVENLKSLANPTQSTGPATKASSLAIAVAAEEPSLH